MMLHRAPRYTLALAFLALPAAAGAQAFGLNEIGSCAIARGFAVTSNPCADASSIFWNPGAMPARQGLTASAGAALISLKGDFTRDTTRQNWKSDIPSAVVPHLFLDYMSGKAAFGIGVYVPYGLTSQWGDDFIGRFSAKKASLQTIYVQPNFSYQVSQNWSIGGGPVYGHSSVELVQAIDLATTGTTTAGVTFGMLGIPRYTEFARATVKADANAWGAHVGFHGKLNPEWQVGGRFLTPMTFKYDGDATFEQKNTGLVLAQGNVIIPGGVSAPIDAVLASQFTGAGALTPQKVSTQITHPAQAQFGMAYSGFASTVVSGEVAWTGWKIFKQLPVTFLGAAAANSRVLQEDYNNTTAIRVGLEHSLQSGMQLRAGWTYAASAAPQETVTPLLPEQDRQLAMLGVGLPKFGPFALDASYAHIFTPGSRGRVDERTAGGTQAQALALNSGVYTLNANIFSVTLKYAH